MSEKFNVWASVADLMSSLMLIFLFIAVLYLGRVESKQSQIEGVVENYKAGQDEIQTALRIEFDKDLARWNAELLKDNTIRFNNPELMFARGSAQIRPAFQAILENFLPRYYNVLSKHKAAIEEIRIEGHTSSEWQSEKTLAGRYLGNAKLSQERAFAILRFSFANLSLPADLEEWLVKTLRANGLSFAKPILTASGVEDLAISQRVEFKVRPRSDEEMGKVIDQLDKNRVSLKDETDKVNQNRERSLNGESQGATPISTTPTPLTTQELTPQVSTSGT